MKNKANQQEILLVTSTTFFQRQWCEKDSPDNNHLRSQLKQLEEACWNGLLHELLPEIIERSSSGDRLYLWHIWQRKSLLQIELGEFPALVENEHSIVTSFFMPTILFN